MTRSLLVSICALIFACACAGNAEEQSELICHQHLLGSAIPSDSSALKYAPSRLVDILHVALDVTPNFKERTIAGKETIRFKPIARALRELSLDAVDLSV